MFMRKNTQRGVTLVEAMIALLVISVGLLGIASLQLTAMNQNASSLHNSQAVWYAYNMSDRIRANISEFDTYKDKDTASSTPKDCMSFYCIPGHMVDSDIADWATMVGNLPGGRGMIGFNADGLLINVMWDDNGTGVTGTGCDPDEPADLTCYTLVVAE